jgi:FkbM family methyltransferase
MSLARYPNALIRTVLRRFLPDAAKEKIFGSTLCMMSADLRQSVFPKHQIASMEWSLRNLKRVGFVPATVVDVGADHGDWTRMVKRIFPNARVLMVEARPEKEQALRAVVSDHPGAVTANIQLLGPERRESMTFYDVEGGSSIYPEQSSVRQRVVTYPMRPLDDLVSGPVDLLKLDVQGYELEILRGASEVLRSVEVVVSEISLIPINKGAPLLADVVAAMRDYGFVAYDICSFIRRPLDEALWQTDFIFVRATSPLLSSHRFDSAS